MAEEQLFAQHEIEAAIKDVFESFGRDTYKIKEQVYIQIKECLNQISSYMIQIERKAQLQNTIKASKLKNAYAPEFGFSQSDIAYKIQGTKKDSSLIYHKLNEILGLIRGSEINYVLYIKDIKNEIHRYEVPASEYQEFTETVMQNNPFLKDKSGNYLDSRLRAYSEAAIEKLKFSQDLSAHIEKYLQAIDATGLKVRLPDKYEAFEYHYQNIDSMISINHSNFNIEGIKKWLLGRGHDTAGWWVRGDIGLTSVKSVNLNNKFLFLSIASQKSLQEVYQILTEIFESNILTPQKMEKIVRAFTPTIIDLQKNLNIDSQLEIKKTVEQLLRNLT